MNRRTDPSTLYHGTNATLQPGDVLDADHVPIFEDVERCVYATEDLLTAWFEYAFTAAMTRRAEPHVYVVELLDAQDWQGGEWRGSSARVLREVDPAVIPGAEWVYVELAR